MVINQRTRISIYVVELFKKLRERIKKYYFYSGKVYFPLKKAQKKSRVCIRDKRLTVPLITFEVYDREQTNERGKEKDL